jgi:plasmid stabilization system protein ParE
VSYVLRLTTAAQDDIREIARYLDRQDPRIGDRGLIAIEKTLSRIERTRCYTRGCTAAPVALSCPGSVCRSSSP